MKIALQSLAAAAALHGIYHITTLAVGYVKTVNYEPDWDAAWENAEMLPNEVTFGHTVSPFLYAGTFIGTALLCGLFIILFKKFIRKEIKAVKP